MMTINEITKRLDTLGNDVCYDVYDDKLEITLNDFEGFDDDWEEVMREFDNPEAVDAMIEWLRVNANKVIDDFYTEFHFDNFVVEVGYASFDI